jgi:hypothetical protein
MSGVTDVTPGWKYLLQNDDLAMVQVTQAADGTVTTSLVTMKYLQLRPFRDAADRHHRQLLDSATTAGFISN